MPNAILDPTGTGTRKVASMAPRGADLRGATVGLLENHKQNAALFLRELGDLPAGFSKADVQDWLLERCGRTQADLRWAGKDGLHGRVRYAASPEEAGGDPDAFSRILPSRQHVPIVVASARNAAISMVVRVFGLWSGTATPVEAAAVAPAGDRR
jgi:hypothetical protein